MSVAKIVLQHLDSKERAKERREDRLFDLVKLAEAREYQEKLNEDNREIKRKEQYLNSLEREYLNLVGERRVQEKELQEANVNLSLVSDLYETKGPEEIIKNITEIDFDNYEDLSEYYTNNIKNINTELDIMKDVLSDEVAKVNNIVKGGALATYTGGIALGGDREGLDVGDFGIDAYNAIYGEQIDTSTMTENEIKALEIEGEIISDLFDKAHSDMQKSYDDAIDLQIKREGDISKQEYYTAMSEAKVKEDDTLKAGQYELDLKGFIRNSTINLDYDQYQALGTLNQDQIDEQDSVNETSVADKMGQLETEIGIAFIKSQGLEDDLLQLTGNPAEQIEMIESYFDLYQDMIYKSNAQTEVRLGTTVKSNFEDYYLYASDAYRNYLDEQDPNKREQLEKVIRNIYGVPKMMTLEGFFEQLDIRYGHIDETYSKFNANQNLAVVKDKVLQDKKNVYNQNVIDILQKGNK